MMESTRLAMVFKDSGGGNMTISLSNANPDATDAQVKALMDGVITNKTAFVGRPTSKVSAELITTTTTPLDVLDE